jgi:hypothetical protein
LLPKPRYEQDIAERLRIRRHVKRPNIESEDMHKPVKYVEKAVTVAAKGTWAVFERLNRIKPNASPTPKCPKTTAQVLRKSKPPLGWRHTDSLSEVCA